MMLKKTCGLKMLLFSAVTGVLSALVITLYKTVAHYVITLSQKLYTYLADNFILIVPVIILLYFAALLLVRIYKKFPQLRGGGIPVSICASRGYEEIKSFSGIIGPFVLSIFSFFVGVPLGNEGPSVQIGAAIGGATKRFYKGEESEKLVGAGACAGFGVATGSPLASLAFAFEETRVGFSFLTLLSALSSVLFAYITTKILSVVLNINNSLFPKMQHIVLSIKDIWLPVVVGVVSGIFAVLFLKYYKFLYKLFNKALAKISLKYKLFAVLTFTVVLGVCSYSFVSTGHELMLSLFDSAPTLLMLAIILLVRSTLTLSANSNGITGGMFVPSLVLGAVAAAITALALGSLFGLEQQYYTIIIAFGIAACIAGVMKMPITAILFSVEALSCFDNIFYVIIVCVIAYLITKLSGVETVTDSVVESKIKAQNQA